MPLPCRWVSQKCVCLCIGAAVHDFASLQKKDLRCEDPMSPEKYSKLKFNFNFIHLLNVCFWLLKVNLMVMVKVSVRCSIALITGTVIIRQWEVLVT